MISKEKGKQSPSSFGDGMGEVESPSVKGVLLGALVTF